MIIEISTINFRFSDKIVYVKGLRNMCLSWQSKSDCLDLT